MTNFEISIFHKMPAAAVLRLLRRRPQLRPKILAATRGTVYSYQKVLNFFLKNKESLKLSQNFFHVNLTITYFKGPPRE